MYYALEDGSWTCRNCKCMQVVKINEVCLIFPLDVRLPQSNGYLD